MRLPIIVSSINNLNLYYTLGEAQSAIEPIDVRDNEYTVYDADGMLLNPEVLKEKGIEYIEIIPTKKDRSDELMYFMIDFFSQIGHDELVLQTMNLSQLIEIGKAYFNPKWR